MRAHSLVGLRGVITLATLLILGGFFVVVTADESSSTSTENLLCGSLDAASASSWGSSHVTASAKWSGFTPSSASPVRYQVAFASERGSLAQAFDASSSSRCLSNTNIEPDLTHWHEVSASGILEASLKLKSEQENAPSFSYLIVKAIAADGRSVLARARISHAATKVERVTSSSPSPLSSAWAGYGSVADYLNAVYGQVNLPINYGNDGTVNGNKNNDDDGYSAITKAGIVIATVVGPTILIALLILLLCGGGSEASFSGGGVVATEFPGVRGNLSTENQATAVERSYPSTALDLNQKIEAPAADVQQQSGRTNLSNALQSKTPSDRDYRTAAGI